MSIRIAYLISAYKDPPHLLRLVEALSGSADFYIHLDANSNLRPFEELLKDKATFVPRHKVSWGGWSQVEFQIELLKAALYSGKSYDRIVCLSGQDYPLWSNKEIECYFASHPDTEFIMGFNITRSQHKAQLSKIRIHHFFRDLQWKNKWLKNKIIVGSRFMMKLLPFRKKEFTCINGKRAEVFCGSDYWALTGDCARYVYETMMHEKTLKSYFKHSFAPSEMCIQTVVFNSGYARKGFIWKEKYQGLDKLTPLHYIHYQKSIKELNEKDLPTLEASRKMFCRKVVSGYSDKLTSAIEVKRNRISFRKEDG